MQNRAKGLVAFHRFPPEQRCYNNFLLKRLNVEMVLNTSFSA